MNLIESYRNPKVEIRKSKIQGNGIFAIEAIHKDEIIAIKMGYLISKEEIGKLPKKCKDVCLQIEDDFFIGPKNINEYSTNTIYINHSCNPNVGIRGQITIVAMRDIKKDEELTMDYSMFFTKFLGHEKMECNCGALDCRKKLSENDWKLNKYGGYYSTYILKKLLNEY
jgi:SET domain-containing protein